MKGSLPENLIEQMTRETFDKVARKSEGVVVPEYLAPKTFQGILKEHNIKPLYSEFDNSSLCYRFEIRNQNYDFPYQFRPIHMARRKGQYSINEHSDEDGLLFAFQGIIPDASELILYLDGENLNLIILEKKQQHLSSEVMSLLKIERLAS